MISFNIFTRYRAGETAITIKELVKHKVSPLDDDVSFVDLIVCPNFFVAYNEDMIDFYGLSKGKYRGKGRWSPTKNGNGTDLRKVFEDIKVEGKVFQDIRKSEKTEECNNAE